MDTQSRVEKAIVALLSALLAAFAVAWLLMLALGAAHSLWPEIPAPGYWTVFIVLIGLDVYVSVRQYLAKRRAAKKSQN